MKLIIRLSLSFLYLLLFFAACKDNEPVEPDFVPEIEATLFNLHVKSEELVDKFYEIGEAQQISMEEAILRLETELKDDPAFEEVYLLDSTYLHYTINGMTEVFKIIEMDEEGDAIYRGSSKSQAIFGNNIDSSAIGNKIIQNQKVMCFVPALDDFYRGRESRYQSLVIDKILGSDLEMEVDVFYKENATYDQLLKMGDYGLVFIESHGLPDAFTIGGDYGRFHKKDNVNNAEEYKAFLRNEVGENIYQGIISGDLRLTYYVRKNPSDPAWWEKELVNKLGIPTVEITSKGIKNLNLNLPGTIIVGNMCYSGYTDPTKGDNGPIQPAIMSLNPIAYYSYINKNDDKSQIVTNRFALACEDSLINSLLYDIDTTGQAHLWNEIDIPTNQNTINPLQFRLSGDAGYRYGCKSFVDPRDNQEYRVACIGGQTWMAENLNFAGAGICFDGRTDHCSIYGRLYTKEEATGGIESNTNPSNVRGICPEGWHIPSMAEWMELFNNTCGIENAGKLLKANSELWEEPEYWGTDIYGFGILPSGTCYTDSDGNLDCANEGDDAIFLTSSPSLNPGGHTVFFQESHFISTISPSPNEKINCRCVKDK